MTALRKIHNQRNKFIDLKKFNKRLTNWATFEELDSATDNFADDTGTGYGKSFVIKRDNATRRFAIFIHEENKLKRKEDETLKCNLGDLLLQKLFRKREGVSIFKCYLMYK